MNDTAQAGWLWTLATITAVIAAGMAVVGIGINPESPGLDTSIEALSRQTAIFAWAQTLAIVAAVFVAGAIVLGGVRRMLTPHVAAPPQDWSPTGTRETVWSPRPDVLRGPQGDAPPDRS